MDWPAKGPGSGPFAVGTVATTGSPACKGSLTPVMCAAKYCEKRVSRKRRSPMGSAGRRDLGGFAAKAGRGAGATADDDGAGEKDSAADAHEDVTADTI